MGQVIHALSVNYSDRWSITRVHAWMDIIKIRNHACYAIPFVTHAKLSLKTARPAIVVSRYQTILVPATVVNTRIIMYAIRATPNAKSVSELQHSALTATLLN